MATHTDETANGGQPDATLDPDQPFNPELCPVHSPGPEQPAGCVMKRLLAAAVAGFLVAAGWGYSLTVDRVSARLFTPRAWTVQIDTWRQAQDFNITHHVAPQGSLTFSEKGWDCELGPASFGARNFACTPTNDPQGARFSTRIHCGDVGQYFHLNSVHIDLTCD